MKRICSIILAVLLVLNIGVYAAKGFMDSISATKVLKNLEKGDFVRNVHERWDEDSKITRRDMFKIAYIIRNNFNRGYYDNKFNGYEKAMESANKHYESESWRNYQTFRFPRFEFVDIEPDSDDFYLAVNLYTLNLLSGKMENGEIFADLDGYATYNDVFASCLKMLTTDHQRTDDYIRYYYEKYYPEETDIYYRFVEDVGIINSKNPLQEYRLDVEREQINDEITAYECLYIINEFLYIHCQGVGYEPSTNNRKIDYFTDWSRNVVGDRDIKEGIGITD